LLYDGSCVEFDSGKFDDWCVYLTLPGRARYAPRDNEYFADLVRIGETYSNIRIYNEFIEIYNRTTRDIDDGVLALITELAKPYGRDRAWIDRWHTVMYAGMVAEENKEFAKLGKRLKRLGLYQCLREGCSADDAAQFSRGKKWRELDQVMQARGF
jgi:hypothetical protein